ncbi:MAG: CtsR family transcriptional regulator [Firmicutes bacterium]|nr:CtsR family transcriptional regulator [Bacillota bacterium]
MRNLSDQIEHYLIRLLEKSEDGVVVIQRSELAEVFQCAPSQINYVLGTRFTVERGYIVESRRGGGGFVRVIKLNLNDMDELMVVLNELIGEEISQPQAEDILKRLQEEGILNERELSLLRAIISRDTLRLKLPERDIIRARIMRAVLLTIIRTNSKQSEQEV